MSCCHFFSKIINKKNTIEIVIIVEIKIIDHQIIFMLIKNDLWPHMTFLSHRMIKIDFFNEIFLLDQLLNGPLLLTLDVRPKKQYCIKKLRPQMFQLIYFEKFIL